MAMTPTQYEHHVAEVLAAEGWHCEVSPPTHDLGLDIVCEKQGRRLGVQVKMYGGGRPVNSQIVMQLYGAAAYRDCGEAMIATDGRILDDARFVAKKLGVSIRIIAASGIDSREADLGGQGTNGWTFDSIWERYVMDLEGRTLTRHGGSANVVLAVDWGGLTRRTSNGKVQRIEIEIFQWVIERLLAGETVLRDEINDQYVKRASSGIVLIVGSLPMFDTVKVGRKSGLRLRVES